jgi:putative ABC transport system permease protein
MLTLRRLFGAFVAVTLGVTVVACSCLLLVAGRPVVPDRWARAAVVVQSPEAESPANPFPPTVPWSAEAAEALAARLAALPGVAAAIPDRTFYAQPLGDDRITEGHGWSSVRLGGARLVAGRPPQRPGEVVLDRAPGPVTLLTATGPATYTVTGTIDRPELYLADPAAAALAPGVRAVGLVLEPAGGQAGDRAARVADADRVAAAARGVVGPGDRVHTGDGRAAMEPRSDARTRWIGMQVLTATAALAGFATVFVVSATFALVVAQRRRELAMLRTVGAVPRQVSRLLRREALTVGAAGSVAGTALGTALAPALGGVLVRAGLEPESYTVSLAAWPIAVALLFGPVVASVGVSVSAWRAARVRPLEALRDAAVEQRAMGRARWSAGILLVALGVGCGVAVATAAEADFALLSAMALVAAAAVLAPAVIPAVARVLTWPAVRLPGATGLLVRQGLLAAPRRAAAVAAPVLLTVAFVVLVAGLVQTTASANAARRAGAVAAERVVAPDGTPGLTDAAVASAPGIAVLPTTVFAGDRPLVAAGVEPTAWARVQRRLQVTSGSLGALGEPGTVAVTASAGALAGRNGLEVTFADGSRSALRVVAVLPDGVIPGDLLLPRAVVRQHDPSALTSAVYVDGAASVPPAAGARVLDVRAHAAEADAAEDRLVWVFTLLLIGVTAGYGAVAVAITLLMSAAGRAPDLGVLRRSGATTGRIRRMLAGEAAVVVVVGALLGGAAAAVALVGIRAGLAEQAGTAVPLVLPWAVIGGVVGLCLLLAVAAAVLPTMVRSSRHA